jgi:type II restriction/modification system DNA methylase subunit YeeA
MKLIQQQTIQESLSVSYQIEKIGETEFNLFKKNLVEYLSKINPAEHEENAKYPVRDFLRDTFFKDKNEINTKGRIDFAIYEGDQPVVIIETKRASIKTDPDMVRAGNLNAKAMYQLVLYFLEERIQHKNINIKYLVATNMHEWFIFDAALFEKLFFKNKTLVKDYTEWRAKAKVSSDRDLFYKQIAKPLIEELEPNIAYTYFDIRDAEKLIKQNTREANKKLSFYFKVFSPRHLLKETARNDSNQLNKEFYSELLHIIGLEEIKDGGKKRIDRKKKDVDEGSLLENTINILKTRSKLQNIDNLNQYGEKEEDQLFSVALELCITWLNRVLFLKLLEGQLITFHRNDPSYAFLNTGKIADFDELDELFFEVLAVPQAKRSQSVIKKFGNIPYLNSSLFEASTLENSSLRIADLKDRLDLTVYSGTVLKDNADKRYKGKKNTLHYLFEFLNAYDFASEDTENIVVKTKKDVINASVLGLIFEKINGYKDGSFFTPGFITEYMCRESLRRAVAEKFKVHEASIESFEDVKSYVHKFYKKEDLKKFNQTINSIKVCDPAVGSGHFLVSALNELLAIKSELGILIDAEGQPLEYLVKIENDTLIVTHRSTNDPFNYLLDKDGTPPIALQKVQQALFHEKQKLIEGCLFGVDINPKSVMICRLRLWIELLKHAYYITDGKTKKADALELQTLPNIDINIKAGNSLISRFDIKADLGKALRSIKYNINQYRGFVNDYKNATDKETKHGLLKIIDQIKGQFRTEIAKYTDPRVVRIQKLSEELYLKYQGTQLFDSKLTEEQKKKRQKLVDEHEKLSTELEEAKNSKIYQNAFEWRFEFPEVLDDNGDFIGFDAVIGNPPYISLQKIKDSTKLYSNQGFQTFTKLGDLYCLFYEKGISILKENGNLAFITSNSWLRTQYGEPLRKFFIEKSNPQILINIEDTQIFEEATVESNIMITQRSAWNNQLRAASLNNEFSIEQPIQEYFDNSYNLISNLDIKGWIIGEEHERILKQKIENGSKLLGSIGLSIYRGVTTGANDAFYIDKRIKDLLEKEDSKSKELIKPAIRGRDIQKYQISKDDLYLIFSRRGVDIESYKSIKKYLLQFKDALLPKPDDWDEEKTGEWKGRKPGPYKWYEIQDNTAYFQEFDKEKIVWGELSDEPKFAIDDEKLYPNNTIFFMTGSNLKYISSVLNSKLSKWYFNQISTSSGMGTNRWLKYKIEQLPIKEIGEKERKPFELLVDKIIAQKKKDRTADTSALETEIDKAVYKLYNLTPDEVKIIEGE